MALIVRGSKQKHSAFTAHASPTIALEAAVKEFDLILTNEQRLVFQGNYFKPQPDDVIAFVSRIDADNKGRARKCVAPRLCTFLESVVQFTGIVDTFVQSNPTIAALVWGSVKTTILAASNIASYFEKVTILIMQVGRTAPTLRSFGQLYPGSNGLQSALCEYYTVIVRLCIKIVQLSQRASIVQILAPVLTPFEAEFKPFIDELSQAAKQVDVQVSLASKTAAQEEAKCAELERSKNSKHRRLVQRFQSDTKKELEDLQRKRKLREQAKLRRSIGQSLSSFDCISSWRQAKSKLMPGTAEWFQQDENFRRWRTSSSSVTLWCCGKLGSGKSIFMSNVVSHLLADRSDKDMISHLFCRFDEKATLDARKIMGAISNQLLQLRLNQMNNTELETVLLKVQDFGAVQLTEHVISLLDDKMTYFVVIDGLDELDAQELSVLGRCLTVLTKGTHYTTFKLIISSRQANDTSSLLPLIPDYKIQLQGQGLDDDIERFIQTSLDQNLEDGKLRLSDPNLIIKIVNALQQGANGMFLWARLLIEEICEQHSDPDIIHALESLPKELSDIFDLKLARIRSGRSCKKAIKLLQLCGAVREPLHTDQLRELVAVEVGQRLLAEGEFINDMQRLVNACCGLLETDEETACVRYVHFSVKQHLFSSHREGDEFNEQLQDQQLGYLCITYLNFIDLKTQLFKPVTSGTNMNFTALEIGLTATRMSAPTASIARHLLRRIPKGRQIGTKDLSNHVNGMPEIKLEAGNRHFEFLPYARSNWIYHLKKPLNLYDHQIWEAFISCTFGSNELADRPWSLLRDLPTLLEASDELILAQAGLQALWDWIIANEIGSLLSHDVALKLGLNNINFDELMPLLRRICHTGNRMLFDRAIKLCHNLFEDTTTYVNFLGSILQDTVLLENDSAKHCLRSSIKVLPLQFSWAPFCLLLRHLLHSHNFRAAALLLTCSEGELLGLLNLRHILLRESIALDFSSLFSALLRQLPNINDPLDTVIYDFAEKSNVEFHYTLLDYLFPYLIGLEEPVVSHAIIEAILESCRMAAMFPRVTFSKTNWPGGNRDSGPLLPLTAEMAQLSILQRGKVLPVTIEHDAITNHNVPPLIIATRCTIEKYVEHILRQGARLEYPYTALEAAAINPDSRILSILLVHAASHSALIYGSKALDYAVWYANELACEKLLWHYYEVCTPPAPLRIAYSAVMQAIRQKNIWLIRILVASFNRWHETLLEIPEWQACTKEEMEKMDNDEIILQILSTTSFDSLHQTFIKSLETRCRLSNKRFELEA